MEIKKIKLNLENDVILSLIITFSIAFTLIMVPISYQITNKISQHITRIKNAQKSSIRKAGEKIAVKSLEGNITKFKIAKEEEIIVLKEENNLIMIQDLKGRIGYIDKNSKLKLNL